MRCEATDHLAGSGGSRRPLPKTVLAVSALALSASVLGACSSASGPSHHAANRHAATETSSAKAKTYVVETGTGNKTLPSVTLPASWTVNWSFDCQDSPTKKTFVLTSTKVGAHAATVTDQTGLGGGGNKPYAVPGKYHFAIATACGWKVSVASKPTPAPVKATTTTAKPAPHAASSKPAASKAAKAAKPAPHAG